MGGATGDFCVNHFLRDYSKIMAAFVVFPEALGKEK